MELLLFLGLAFLFLHFSLKFSKPDLIFYFFSSLMFLFSGIYLLGVDTTQTDFEGITISSFSFFTPLNSDLYVNLLAYSLFFIGFYMIFKLSFEAKERWQL